MYVCMCQSICVTLRGACFGIFEWELRADSAKRCGAACSKFSPCIVAAAPLATPAVSLTRNALFVVAKRRLIVCIDEVVFFVV